MYLSTNWLKRYVDIPKLSLDEIGEMVSTRIAEVESTFYKGVPLEHAIVVTVIDVDTHPEKDKLKLVTINDGSNNYSVVCGAPNVRRDMVTAFIPADGFKFNPQSLDLELVESKDLQGSISQGVLCSEAELDVSSDHEGIVDLQAVFPEQTINVGSSLTDLYGSVDIIFEIDNKSLTHRPDLWSHLGFAREFQAIFNCKPIDEAVNLKKEPDLNSFIQAKSNFTQKYNQKVSIDSKSECLRFTSLLIDFDNELPISSPAWIRRPLHNIGAGIHSPLVDLSNFVLYDIGQPNHVYDRSKLDGIDLSIDIAGEEEQFLALNGETLSLNSKDVVVKDKKNIVALGGVIGGESSSVSNSTLEILLECATFNKVRVRKTAKSTAVRTDSAMRFEKGLTPELTQLATQRFLELLDACKYQHAIVSLVADAYPIFHEQTTIPLNFETLQSRLAGSPSQKATAIDILERLQFTVSQDTVTTPWFRSRDDISLHADLVEEVGRCLGYENIPVTAPSIKTSCSNVTVIRSYERRLEQLLCGAGLSQISLYSFFSPEKASQLGYDTHDAIQLLNSVDSSQSHMRTTLVPGVIDALNDNLKHYNSVSCFELGRAYHKPLTDSQDLENFSGVERRLLTACISNSKDSLSSKESTTASSGFLFYNAVEIIKKVVAIGSSQKVSFCRAKQSSKLTKSEDFSTLKTWMHPHRSASVFVGTMLVGIVAEVRPSLVNSKDNRAVIIEIDLDAILATDIHTKVFNEIDRFPSSFFELSIVTPSRLDFMELEASLDQNMNTPDDVAVTSDVVSVYEGKPLEEGQKSVSIRFSFQRKDRTIQSEELDKLRDATLIAVENSGFEIRS